MRHIAAMETKIKFAHRPKCRDVPAYNVLYLHDNARPHHSHRRHLGQHSLKDSGPLLVLNALQLSPVWVAEKSAKG